MTTADTTGLDRLAEQSEHRRYDGTSSTSLVLPSPSTPMQVAREFVAAYCLHDGRALTIL